MNAAERTGHYEQIQRVDDENFLFSNVMVGGTFDRLHEGHHALLLKAFSVGAQVHIGVTSDEFLQSRQKVMGDKIQPYETRVECLDEYVRKNGFTQRAEIVPLGAVFAPGALENTMEAIVITPDSIKGAELINQNRREIGASPLALIIVDFIRDETGEVVSSTRLRQKEQS